MNASRNEAQEYRSGAFPRKRSASTHLTLLARLSEADNSAWREFCDRYGMLIKNYALKAGLGRHDCDEVFQVVNEALFKRMKRFVYDPEKGTFRGYLRAVVNHAILAVRTKGNELSSFTPYPGGTLEDMSRIDSELDAIWEAEWRRNHMARAMKLVSSEFNSTDRRAFELYAMQDHSAEETARRLDISLDQVYKAKSRILKRLQERVDRQIEEEG